MSAGRSIPMAVLSQQLAEAIRGRRVRSAVFTTFVFDPGFFEDQVLPLLFDEPFSHIDKVRKIQLEEVLSGVDVGVYYDRRGLTAGAEPAWLDYARIDIGRRTGFFHPKIVLLLVDEPPEAAEEDGADPGVPYQSLIVGIQSANLTRAGWWENVECAHLEEVRDRDLDSRRCAFRSDLLSLIRQLRESTPESDDHVALDSIHAFLRHRTTTGEFKHASTQGVFFTRIFHGQRHEDLTDWLVGLHMDLGLNLEVISPYFDPGGAGPLDDLIEALEPREVRVLLPKEPDGAASVTSAAYNAIAEIPRCYWSTLPPEVTARGKGLTTERLAPRRVHAKVYRLWSRDGPEVIVAGSVNLTASGHSHAGAGNMEAAVLVDAGSTSSARRWWLERIDREPKRFTSEVEGEDEGVIASPLALSVRFDWRSGRLSYRLEEEEVEWLELSEVSGRSLLRLETPRAGAWADLSEEIGARARELLRSTSFLTARAPGREWRVLVREEGMAQRPSLLLDLTPEEILEYWSLLTPDQRVAYIEKFGGLGEDLEGLVIGERRPLLSRDTLFDRFAGIYHAFGCLRKQVEESLDEERPREAEARLLGAKYDSLPALLSKMRERDDADPVISYVTFLSARQLLSDLQQRDPEFFKERRGPVERLEALLGEIPEIREQISLGPEGEAFFDWYEPVFLRHVPPGARR